MEMRDATQQAQAASHRSVSDDVRVMYFLLRPRSVRERAEGVAEGGPPAAPARSAEAICCLWSRPEQLVVGGPERLLSLLWRHAVGATHYCFCRSIALCSLIASRFL
jgi:hypothetical protein